MAAVRSLYGIHRKRPDGVGELAFGQCHSSLGNGGPRKWPGWHARLPFAAREFEVNRARQDITGKPGAVPRQLALPAAPATIGAWTSAPTKQTTDARAVGRQDVKQLNTTGCA